MFVFTLVCVNYSRRSHTCFNYVSQIFVLYNINNNQIDTFTLYMVKEPISFSYAFGHGSLLVQINLQHSQAQPYGLCTRFIYQTQTHLYVEHHTENQLVTFLQSLLWLVLWWIRTLDLPNSNQTLYHYTIDSVNLSDFHRFLPKN